MSEEHLVTIREYVINPLRRVSADNVRVEAVCMFCRWKVTNEPFKPTPTGPLRRKDVRAMAAAHEADPDRKRILFLPV